MASTLLLIHTQRQRFVVSSGDVYAIRSVAAADAPEPQAIHVALGTLFGQADSSNAKRHHGMVVPLRRKVITFLVDRIDTLDTPPHQHPLPALLSSRLQAPWSLGVYEIEQQLVIQIDIRAIARSVLAGYTSNGKLAS